jgi:hypothetical protein
MLSKGTTRRDMGTVCVSECRHVCCRRRVARRCGNARHAAQDWEDKTSNAPWKPGTADKALEAAWSVIGMAIAALPRLAISATWSGVNCTGTGLAFSMSFHLFRMPARAAAWADDLRRASM